MARPVIVLGLSHNPFHYWLRSQPRENWSEDTARFVERSELLRGKLTEARPDVLVVVGNDHFHQFFMDNMPQFIIGKMQTFDGIYYNEVREFGLPRCTVPGDEDLATHIIEESFPRGVDYAFSNEMKVDHSVIVPLLQARPEMDLPIVPIMTNCVAPPIPPAERFLQVGRVLRDVLDQIPPSKRVAVIASGNLSLEVGGPTQFLPQPHDAEFDERAVEMIRNWDIDGLLKECSFDRMTQAGNVTHAFTNFLIAMALADGLECTYAEGMLRKGSTQPFFSWEAK